MERTRPDTALVQRIAHAALGGDVAVEPVDVGVSTYVYRLMRGGEVLYLRILPDEGATFAPEVAAHKVLGRQGVRVPEVVYWTGRDELAARSVMITTEIAGTSVGDGGVEAELPGILRAVGRDLATLNRVPVDGFGWVRRDVPLDMLLRAEYPTEHDFMLADLDHALDVISSAGLVQREGARIRSVIYEHIELLDATHACLAHGDFDVTHIYSDHGRYTGIIDLGEIRGTGPYYDLGHFRFHDGEIVTVTLSAYLLEGYQEITPLPPDAGRRIALASLLIGVRFLARTHARLTQRSRNHAVAAIMRELKVLSA